MEKEYNEKIVNLEMKITFLEDSFNKVNEVIIEQDQEIYNLKKKLKELELQVQGGNDASSTEKPPHY